MCRQDYETLVPSRGDERQYAVGGGILARVSDGGLETVMAVGDIERARARELRQTQRLFAGRYPEHPLGAVELGDGVGPAGGARGPAPPGTQPAPRLRG